MSEPNNNNQKTTSSPIVLIDENNNIKNDIVEPTSSSRNESTSPSEQQQQQGVDISSGKETKKEEEDDLTMSSDDEEKNNNIVVVETSINLTKFNKHNDETLNFLPTTNIVEDDNNDDDDDDDDDDDNNNNNKKNPSSPSKNPSNNNSPSTPPPSSPSSTKSSSSSSSLIKKTYKIISIMIKWCIILSLILISIMLYFFYSNLDEIMMYFSLGFFGKACELVTSQFLISNHSIPLPMVRINNVDEVEEIKNRLELFRTDFVSKEDEKENENDDGGVAMIPNKEDLVLTEREINGLICEMGEMLCGKVYVTIEENSIVTKFSFPVKKENSEEEEEEEKEQENDNEDVNQKFLVGTHFITIHPHKMNKRDQISSSSSSYSISTSLMSHDGDVYGDEGMPIINATAVINNNIIETNNQNNEQTVVDIRMQSAELFGLKTTDVFIRRFFDHWNLALMMSSLLDRIGSVHVGHGRIVIRFRNGDNGNVVVGGGGGGRVLDLGSKIFMNYLGGRNATTTTTTTTEDDPSVRFE